MQHKLIFGIIWVLRKTIVSDVLELGDVTVGISSFTKQLLFNIFWHSLRVIPSIKSKLFFIFNFVIEIDQYLAHIVLICIFKHLDFMLGGIIFAELAETLHILLEHNRQIILQNLRVVIDYMNYFVWDGLKHGF
jgi:hypothetical protein